MAAAEALDGATADFVSHLGLDGRDTDELSSFIEVGIGWGWGLGGG